MTVVAVPDGMLLLDGIPVPKWVDGVAVKMARRAATDGVHYGRTHLVLENFNTTQGCVDCPHTDRHWAALARHRHEMHGAPIAWRNGHGVVTKNGHTQLELTDRDNDEPIVISVEPEQVSRPSIETKTLLRMPSELLNGMLRMTMDEVLATAVDRFAAGKAIEDLKAERDYWKQRFKELEKETKRAAKDLAKVSAALTKKDED